MAHMTFRYTCCSILLINVLYIICTIEYLFPHCDCWSLAFLQNLRLRRMFSKSKRFGENIHGASCPGPATYKIKLWWCWGPAAKAEGKKATSFAHASGEEAPHGSLQKATVQRTFQDRTTKLPCQRLQWLERHLWVQGLACQRCNRDVFLGTLKVQETPVALKRILKPNSDEMVHDFFREFKIMKAGQHQSIATVFSAYGVTGQNVGPINDGASHWQWLRPRSVQQCRSCGAVFALRQNCTSRMCNFDGVQKLRCGIAATSFTDIRGKYLLHSNQDLQQAGLQLSGQSWNGWGTLPVPKETTQITQITSILPIKPLPSCIDGMIQCTIVAV